MPAHPFHFDIAEPHPFLRRFTFLEHPLAPLYVGAMSLALFMLAAFVDGNFTQNNLHPVLCRDALSYLDLSRKTCGDYAFASRMSATRDVGTLLLVVLFPMTIPLMFRQWQNIASFLSAMDSRGILDVASRPAVTAEVTRCNAYFRRFAAYNPVVGLVALMSMLFVARAQTSGPVYPILKTSPSGTGIRPEQWWITLSGTDVSGGLYLVVGVIVIYVILLQNIHGSRVVLLLWRLRREISYEADPSNPDGWHGWSEVRGILFATWSLTIIHGICLGLVGLSLPSGQTKTLAPLFGQWLIVTPFYMLVPGVLTRRNISAWKARERAALNATLTPTSSPADHSHVAHQLAQLKKVRVNPYSGVIQRGFHYIGIIGSLVFVIQIIKYLYR